MTVVSPTERQAMVVVMDGGLARVACATTVERAYTWPSTTPWAGQERWRYRSTDALRRGRSSISFIDRTREESKRQRTRGVAFGQNVRPLVGLVALLDAVVDEVVVDDEDAGLTQRADHLLRLVLHLLCGRHQVGGLTTKHSTRVDGEARIVDRNRRTKPLRANRIGIEILIT